MKREYDVTVRNTLEYIQYEVRVYDENTLVGISRVSTKWGARRIAKKMIKEYEKPPATAWSWKVMGKREFN